MLEADGAVMQISVHRRYTLICARSRSWLAAVHYIVKEHSGGLWSFLCVHWPPRSITLNEYLELLHMLAKGTHVTGSVSKHPVHNCDVFLVAPASPFGLQQLHLGTAWMHFWLSKPAVSSFRKCVCAGDRHFTGHCVVLCGVPPLCHKSKKKIIYPHRFFFETAFTNCGINKIPAA